jgi:hypothetical protein
MERDKLRGIFNRAKQGEAIPGSDVVEVLNYLATVEFEVDCATLDVQQAKAAASRADRLRDLAAQAEEVLRQAGKMGRLPSGGEERGNALHCHDLANQLRAALATK